MLTREDMAFVNTPIILIASASIGVHFRSVAIGFGSLLVFGYLFEIWAAIRTKK